MYCHTAYQQRDEQRDDKVYQQGHQQIHVHQPEEQQVVQEIHVHQPVHQQIDEELHVHQPVHQGIQEETPDKGTNNLWDQTFSKVKDILAEDAKFQLVYPFIDWTWRTPPSGYIDPTAYSILSQIPSWSTIGRYSPSPKDLYSSYTNMIAKCPKLTIPPALLQQLKEAEDHINRTMRTLEQDQHAAILAFEKVQNPCACGVPPPEYEQWLENSGWSRKLKADRTAFDKAVKTKTLIVAQQHPGYEAAINAATCPSGPYASKPGFVKCTIYGQDEWRAGFTVDDGQDWVNKLTRGGGQPLHISLDASSSSSAIKESWAKGATGYGSSFFGVYTNGEWKDMNLTKEDSFVTIEINIKAVTQVPVRAGAWYNSGYLDVLAKDNYWNPPYTTTGGQSPVFGEGGILPLTIVGMVCSYQIGFKISMSSSTYPRHSSEFQACDGFRIGPFHIGGSYRTCTDSWEHSTDGASFSGQSKAEYPFILGFVVSQPGLD